MRPCGNETVSFPRNNSTHFKDEGLEFAFPALPANITQFQIKFRVRGFLYFLLSFLDIVEAESWPSALVPHMAPRSLDARQGCHVYAPRGLRLSQINFHSFCERVTQQNVSNRNESS